ncbi:uncharacterized protein MSANTD5 [Tamandua tetradactyla]|uniref:uncharacterized protein MSANTD5 n=1 Tax=Tamandua tetradactyla TaxID=48850 RepID=UPI004053E440
MEEPNLQPETTRNSQEVKKEDTQKPKKPTGQLNSPWSVEEIWSFINEWEFFEGVMKPKQRKKKHMLSRSISQGLSKRGIRKSWRECFDMLISLTDLYWTVQEANWKPRPEHLPCPFGEALHRIISHSWEDTITSGGPHEDMANLPSSGFQLQACTILRPQEELMWDSTPMIYVENPQMPGWVHWTPNPPWFPPFPYPAIVLEDSIPQQQWSASSESDTDSEWNNNVNFFSQFCLRDEQNIVDPFIHSGSLPFNKYNLVTIKFEVEQDDPCLLKSVG